LSEDLSAAGVIDGAPVLLAHSAGALSWLMERLWGPIRARVLVVIDGEVSVYTACGYHHGLRSLVDAVPVDRVHVEARRRGRTMIVVDGVGRYLLDPGAVELAVSVLGSR
jgi:hypothetical protein